MKFVRQKNQESFNFGKIRNSNEKRVLFRGKKRFHIFKPSLQNWEDAKDAGGSRLIFV